MKFFTDTVVQHLAGLIDRALVTGQGGEAAQLRIFTQSMPPDVVYQIFQGVEEHLQSKANQIRWVMRVADGLGRHWLNGDVQVRHERTRLEERTWIDDKDQLTHYRNLQPQAGDELLLVLLAGVDHATDRGGLADFHILTDEAIFRDCMGGSFRGWIEEALRQAGLSDANGGAVREFEAFLHKLFQLRPRNLVSLSRFLTDELMPAANACTSAADFLGLAFEHLPYWDVPSILSPANPTKRTILLQPAARFIARDAYREKRERDKALRQIDAVRTELLTPPLTHRQAPYGTFDEFLDTLSDFINLGSVASRTRLMHTDFAAVVRILGRKEKKDSGRPRSDTRLRGPSLQVFLTAIFDCLLEFKQGCRQNWAPALLESLKITVESFEFDGSEEGSQGNNTTAGEVLKGLLGGLEGFLRALPLQLRKDEADQRLPDPEDILEVFWGKGGHDVIITQRRVKESRLRFSVEAQDETGALQVARSFIWIVPPHHEERVRLSSARLMKSRLDEARFLPSIRFGQTLDELYFAIDDGEAQRLFASGLAEAEIVNVLDGLETSELSRDVYTALEDLAGSYQAFIRELVDKGYYAAIETPLHSLVQTYSRTVGLILERDAKREARAEELLRRIYQAFLCVPLGVSLTGGFVPAIVATGITPAIAETVAAREVFLRNGFAQVCALLLEQGPRQGKAALARLFGLVELRRPLYGLVFDSSRRLTTNARAFGLIHRLGERPAVAPTLAAQAEMRSDDIVETESLSDYMRSTPESRIIAHTLAGYRQIHPFAADRMAVLAANVSDLRPVIGGVHAFLEGELSNQAEGTKRPYILTLRVIGRGPSVTAAQEILRQWQERWMEEEDSERRPCRITVAYRPARSRDEVLTLLNQVEALHDVGFLSNFLNDQSGGDSVVPAAPFDWRVVHSGKFPICEHPRPARPSDPNLRQGLVSNRRFKTAAFHAEITARLKDPEHPGERHLIFNQVGYGELERGMTRRMHQLSRWVACVDRFVDKPLILDEDAAANDRKLVGFTSGVGAYGELNLTLSTESNTAGELLQGTAARLAQIYRQWTEYECVQAAHRLVEEAQSVTGLSLVRALGDEGVLRDVIGYAIANRLYLAHSSATLRATIPLDSFAHWFDGADEGLIPDLLLLEAHLDGTRFVVDATIVECKVGQYSADHVEEAVTQAGAGVSHLSKLFVPNNDVELASVFDRRYWWAQLHRAIVVRNATPIQASQERLVDQALERLAEGDFDIRWRAIGATFWTNDTAGGNNNVSLRPVCTVGSLLGADTELLTVFHAEVGQRTVLETLKDPSRDLSSQLLPQKAAVALAARETENSNGRGGASVVEAPECAQDMEREKEVIHRLSPIETALPTEPQSESPVDETDVGTRLVPPVEPATKCGLRLQVPERILLGRELTNQGAVGDPVYWEYGSSSLPNRHLLVFGTSGMGKTYAIQALLLEMTNAGLPSMVIDYTDGFLPRHLEAELKAVAAPDTFALKMGKKLPLDPFRPQRSEIEGLGVAEDSPFDVAKRVASIFTAVYATLGEQQRSTLIDTIERGVESGSFSLQALYEQLQADGQELLANKIMPLARTEPFSTVAEDAWDAVFSGLTSRLTILQLARIPREVQRLIIEFVLWDLWDFLSRTGSKDRPHPVVLDEVQNLDHSPGSPLEKYLREGRKFGASMILATQTLSNFNREERDQLFQAAHKLFFCPAATEMRSFATILKEMMPHTEVDDWAHALSTLRKGECLSAGPELRPDGSLRQSIRRVAITALSERVRVTE